MSRFWSLCSNAPLTIERALASLAFNKEPHDVIIVDDGSTPPLQELLTQQANTCILRLEKNLGITLALNHGLRHILNGNYEYVARMDADDTTLPDRLVLQRAFLDEHPDVAVVGSSAEVVTEQGDTAFYLNCPTDHHVILRKLRYNNCFLHPSSMVRTKVFLELGLYKEGYPSAEDYEFLCRVAGKYRMANLPQYLIKYTLTNSGISFGRRKEPLRSR